MAQIVLIAAGTYRVGVNEIDDVVEVQEDNVKLGPAYDTFQILNVVSVTAQEVKDVFNAKLPKTEMVYRTTEPLNLWSFTEFERKFVWKDGLSWFDLAKRPKHPVSLILTAQDKLDLADSGVTKPTKLTVLGKAQEKIKGEALNQVEVLELRG